MDFSFTDDQVAIREVAHQIFTDRVTDEFLLDFDKNDNTYDEVLWGTLVEQGVLGVCLPEVLGGVGLGFQELCFILEEQGRSVAPVPLFSSLVLGALPLLHFGSGAQQEQWLQPLAQGRIKLTAAIAALSHGANPFAAVNVEGGRLTGALSGVLDGAAADAILVPACDEAGRHSLFIVNARSEGVTVEVQASFSGQNLATVRLENVSADLLGEPGQGDNILSWLEQRVDVALSAQALGVCEEALKRTAAFTGERKQFGAPLGAFQAVAMRAADAYIDIEAMRSAYWSALWRVAEGLEAEAEVRAAKYWACEGSHRVVHAAQHLHGGMGADVEFPIHRFFVMAKQIEFVAGNGAVELARLGELLASDDNAGLRSLAV